MRKDGFLLREFHGIRYYSCRALEALQCVCHGFSTRTGGSAGVHHSSLNLGYTSWDSIKRVDENRRRFLSALNLGDSHLATLSQVHSNRVYIIEDNSVEGNRPQGDALATGMEDIALAVQTADCLPILIADPVKRAVAAVHSGWRGTLERVLLQTILEMERAFDSRPSDLIVAVGPGIRACCFEVGPEVADLFDKDYALCKLVHPAEGRPGKYFLDLSKALEVQMDLAGIQARNRYDLGACTRCGAAEFFSYRAEGSAAGRMMAVIGIKSREHRRLG
jgi:YfiH family protein